MLENKTNKTLRLWFDVGIERDNPSLTVKSCIWLWFDVGTERDNNKRIKTLLVELWFDVGIERYTTVADAKIMSQSCGLM